MSPPRVGLVGAGYWGKNYIRILSQLAAKEQVSFAGVYEADSKLRDSLPVEYKGLRVVDKLETFLEDEELTAVVVVTPASVHETVLDACLKAGKSVLVEKPLTLDTASSRRLVSLARQRHCLLMVGHTFLFNEGIRELKRRMMAPAFGRLHYMHCKRTNLGPIRRDTSVIWDLAPHDVSVVLYVMEGLGKKAQKVSAFGAKTLQGKFEDTAWIHIMFDQNVTAQIHVSWLDPHKVREIVAVGERQRIAVDDMNQREVLKIYEKGVECTDEAVEHGTENTPAGFLRLRDGDVVMPQLKLSEPLTAQVKQFIDSLRDPSVENPSLGAFGADVVAILEAAEQSMAQEGKAVPIDLSVEGGWSPPPAKRQRTSDDGPIPLVDLKANYASLKESIDAELQKVLSTCAFVEGPALKEFEAAFAQFIGVKHCIGLNSGTDALYLAYKYLGLGPGMEIVTQANTFIATVLGASTLGADVKLVDCLPGSYSMDPSKLEAAITPGKTKLIVPVHLYGHPADMDAIMAVAAKHKVDIVEDCAQSHGALFKGKSTGSFGRFSCFSFYPGKNLGAFGDGGALCTNEDALAAQVRAWRSWGAAKKYHHTERGGNSRLDTVQAGVLLAKLKLLPAGNENRRRIAARYNEELAGVGDLVLPQAPAGPDTLSVWHLYVIATRRRDELLSHLHGQGIGAGIHYPTPIHKQEAYKELASTQCPVTEEFSPKILSLPIFPEMTEQQTKRVVDAIKAFFK